MNLDPVLLRLNTVILILKESNQSFSESQHSPKDPYEVLLQSYIILRPRQTLSIFESLNKVVRSATSRNNVLRYLN